ncbi:MAG: hypothetical protein COZ05_22215 [Armatimonadetes bacterium CG_4_10_14_3_um_filter_59_10]|nr:MAG: hypothetical protein COZ05_22215 [Armatimonadetes bacterium CG_4_10_14_3_um_filter_59_10]
MIEIPQSAQFMRARHLHARDVVECDARFHHRKRVAIHLSGNAKRLAQPTDFLGCLHSSYLPEEIVGG